MDVGGEEGSRGRGGGVMVEEGEGEGEGVGVGWGEGEVCEREIEERDGWVFCKNSRFMGNFVNMRVLRGIYAKNPSFAAQVLLSATG